LFISNPFCLKTRPREAASKVASLHALAVQAEADAADAASAGEVGDDLDAASFEAVDELGGGRLPFCRRRYQALHSELRTWFAFAQAPA
jgi:hypothetical protein